MGLILDKLNSFFKSLPAQLDICGHKKEVIYDYPGKKHQYSQKLQKQKKTTKKTTRKQFKKVP